MMQKLKPWQLRSLKTVARAKPVPGLTPARAQLYSLAALLAGVWLSLANDDWHWFARSGAVLVVIGMLLTSSQIIASNRRQRQRRGSQDGSFQHDYADSLAQLQQPLPDEKDISFSHHRGLYLLISGTLIWAFGDLTAALMTLLAS